MSAKKISDLPAADSVDDSDLFEVSQSGVSKKATKSQITSGGGGSSNVSVIDLGVINAADVVRAGQLILLPFKSGQIITKVWFRPDGFVPLADSGPFFFTTPNTVIKNANGYAQWTDRLKETDYAEFSDGNPVGLKSDGTWGRMGSSGNYLRDNGPLIATHDLSWIDTTTDKPRLWTANTGYSSSDYVIGAGHIQSAAPGNGGAAGTSGDTEPTWNTSGGTTSDGTVTWKDVGAIDDIVGALHVIVEVCDLPTVPDLQRPTSFRFAQQPTDVVAGATIDPPIQVQILDQNADPFLLQDRFVRLQIAGAGTLTGTTSQDTDPTTGIATFNDYSIAEAGTYRLVATLDSWGIPYIRLESDPFNVTAP